MPEHIDAESPYRPRTALGSRPLAIRAKIVAFSEPLLSWKEIEQEVEERRGKIK